MNTKFSVEKATQALNFFAIKSNGKIDKIRVLKLIYFAERYHLRKFGRPILYDKYFAMPWGPVASGVKDITDLSSGYLSDEVISYVTEYIKQVEENTLESVRGLDDDVFSESDIEALEYSWSKFKDMKKFALSELTHEYPEWKKFENLIKGQKQNRIEMSYEDFLDDPLNKKVDKCYELTDEERENIREYLQEVKYIDALWS